MNIKVSTRIMTEAERPFCYSQDDDSRSGCIGYLRMDFGRDGDEFWTTWFDHTPELKTPEFKSEFDDLVNYLRSDSDSLLIFKNFRYMQKWCFSNPEANFKNGRDEYGLRFDTKRYTYMLRLINHRGDYNAYLYCYLTEALERNEKSVRNLSRAIGVLEVEPGEPPVYKTIPDELEVLQRSVGGYIECYYPEDGIAYIVNENGKNDQLEMNRAIRDSDNDIVDVICGTFLIAGLGEENFASLTPKQVEHFKQKFAVPEAFLNLGGKLMVIPLD